MHPRLLYRTIIHILQLDSIVGLSMSISKGNSPAQNQHQNHLQSLLQCASQMIINIWLQDSKVILQKFIVLLNKNLLLKISKIKESLQLHVLQCNKIDLLQEEAKIPFPNLSYMTLAFLVHKSQKFMISHTMKTQPPQMLFFLVMDQPSIELEKMEISGFMKVPKTALNLQKNQ